MWSKAGRRATIRLGCLLGGFRLHDSRQSIVIYGGSRLLGGRRHARSPHARPPHATTPTRLPVIHVLSRHSHKETI